MRLHNLILLFFFVHQSGITQIDFDYDNLNRLTQINYGDSFLIQYAYDELGNRTQQIKQSITVLPIQFILFEVEKQGENEAALYWETVNEINVRNFDVERKYNNGTWAKIGEVNAKGNTTNRISYHFNDEDLKNGTYYYRLKIIDFDETHKYSIIVSITISNLFQDITLFPNPTNKNINLIYYLSKGGHLEFKINDLNGNIVRTKSEFISSSGTYNKQFDISSLSKGLYFISFYHNDEKIKTKSFIVQ